MRNQRADPDDDAFIEEAPPETRAVFGHSTGRTAIRVAWLGIALLALAFVKPWTPFQPADPGLIAGDPRAAAAPTAGPTETTRADIVCAGGRWSIEADERWVGEIVRTWALTDAVEASGATDPAIRFVPVAAQQVISLGYCPDFDDAAQGSPIVTFHRLDPIPGVVQTTRVVMPAEAEAARNTLYRPLLRADSPGETPSWPAGRYVIEIQAENGYERWLGVDVRLVLEHLQPASSVPAVPEATVPEATDAAPASLPGASG